VTSHDIYVLGLQWSFALLNYLRICAYVPTLRRLARPGARSDDYSLQTWVIWSASHLAFLMMLLEQSVYTLNAMVVVTFLNLIMCVVTCVFIFRLRVPRIDQSGALGMRK
jgi:hypothetical protein